MSIRIKRKPITSPSAHSLCESLTESGENVKLLKLENSTWRGVSSDLLINWGCSNPINNSVRATILNKPETISNASNKLKSFKLFQEHDVSHPWYVEKSDPEFLSILYERTISNPEATFMFRTTATGYGGEGIYVLPKLGSSVTLQYGFNTISYLQRFLEDLAYTNNEFSSVLNSVKFVSEYFTSLDEFRVHVACGDVIFVQRKSLRTDDQRPESANFYVRNHSNGFIFQQENVIIPDVAKQEAIKAVAALGLDFGAVDIRCKRVIPSRPAIASVLEVNTAPAITGNTLKAYTNTFKTIHKVLKES